jgi:hypothetical protein
MTELDNINLSLKRKTCKACAIFIEYDMDISEGDILPPEAPRTINFCKSCKSFMINYFLIIGIDSTKTTNPDNPYRSGDQWAISVESAKNYFTEKEMERGFIWLSLEKAKEMKLPEGKSYENN